MTNNKPVGKEKSFQRNIVQNVGWVIAMRWVVKFIGFISAAFLARLLTPEDYGLVAVAVVLIGVTQVFFDLGVEMALLKDDKATDEDFNTAWTIRILQASALTLIIPILAPFAADFYQDPRIEEIFYISAIGIFIKGFENIGIVKFAKELRFELDFKFNVLAKIIGTSITIALAFYFRSYYALVIGTVMQNVISVALSFVVIKYRPAFSLASWSKVWGFSQWIIVKNIANYVLQKGDYLILAKLTPLASLGYYRWTQELNSMVAGQLLQPVSKVLLPGLSSIQSDKERFFRVYLKALNTLSTAILPVILGVGGVATEFVPVLLGSQWDSVIPLLEIAVFIVFFRVMFALVNNILIILGHVKALALFDMTKTILVLLALYPVYQYAGLKGIFATKVLVAAITMLYLFNLLVRSSDVTVRHLFDALIRPVIASISMIICLWNFNQLLDMPLFLLLPVKVCLGVIIYTSLLYMLWTLMGKPNTAERQALDLLKQLKGRFI